MPDELSNRDIAAALVKALGRIEKAVGDNDTSKVLKKLLDRIENITATAKGDKGDDGYTPVKGKDYDDGKDGVSIVNASINEEGELVLWYSDKREVNLGVVVGKDGETPTIDEEGILTKLLERVVLPQYDEEAVARRAAELVKIPVPEEKEISYKDLKDKPDLEKLIDKTVAHHMENTERPVYTGPAHAAGIIIKDEGVVIAESVQSIDFRGGNIDVVDLGDGNLVVTVTGGGGASVKTDTLTGEAVQDGDNVRIPLSALSETMDTAEWLSRNGQVLDPGPSVPDGEYSTWEIDGTDIVVYWALTSDRFLFNYTFTA